MAKILWGGSAAEFTVSAATVDATPNVLLLATGVPLVAYETGSDGVALTDLNLFTGDFAVPGGAAPSGVFTSDTTGVFRVWAESTLSGLYVATQANPTVRWVMHPVNLHPRLLAVEAGSGVDVTAALNAQKGIANGIMGLNGSGVADISDLPVGTTSTTVAAGNRVWGLANMPAGYTHFQTWNGVGTTPDRDTTRTDIKVRWYSPVAPTIAAGKAIAGDDWVNTAP